MNAVEQHSLDEAMLSKCGSKARRTLTHRQTLRLKPHWHRADKSLRRVPAVAMMTSCGAWAYCKTIFTVMPRMKTCSVQ